MGLERFLQNPHSSLEYTPTHPRKQKIIIIMLCEQEVGPKFVTPYLLNSHKLEGIISNAK